MVPFRGRFRIARSGSVLAQYAATSRARRESLDRCTPTRRRGMSTSFSVAEILARLEARIAHHEQQMGFHQQQEVHHREQSAAHGAELETVRQHFESFKAAALPAADLAGVLVAPAPAGEEK